MVPTHLLIKHRSQRARAQIDSYVPASTMNGDKIAGKTPRCKSKDLVVIEEPE